MKRNFEVWLYFFNSFSLLQLTFVLLEDNKKAQIHNNRELIEEASL